MFCNDKASGLRSIIAVHNTVLGPALGGTRFWNYAKDEDALVDALRLSRGMTYKAAITGLHLGGGKAVILGDARKEKSEALFRRYGKFVNSLNGKYITAEDVGTNARDMEWIGRETKFVTGLPEYLGGGGDPSPFTAYGVFLGMKAAAKEVYGNDSLKGKKVMVQGVGHVGEYLVGHLIKEGAIVTICDIYEDRIDAVSKAFKVSVVKPDEVFDVDADIYAPCALGATINDDTIDHLKCTIIAGAANNQLKDEIVHGQILLEKGILYAPDYLINAGGLINVAAEWDGYNRDRANAQCERIYDRTLEIFKYAKSKNIPTYKASNEIAEERLRSIASLNSRK
jgi:leucine dehydrogenase